MEDKEFGRLNGSMWKEYRHKPLIEIAHTSQLFEIKLKRGEIPFLGCLVVVNRRIL